MTGHGLEQAVIDAAAKISARTLAHPFQRDVVALARQSQGNEAIDRTTVERVIQSLSPTHLVRGGMPGNPTVALTVSGWLRSNLRPRIAAMVECVLRAYRRKAEETAGAFEELLVGSDLEAAGLVPSDVGLLASCGSALQLFTSPSGLAAASPLANVRIICPWDIDRLLELADAEAFFSYRTKYDLARAIALQRLQLSATGDVKRTVDEIYRRASPEWPPYRAVEVELRRSRVSPAAALADDFVKLVGGAEPVRIALTFRGLHLASLSAPDHEAILAAVRE